MDSACLLSGTPTLGPGCVALTFDDGPGPQTAELSQLLVEKQAPATFFVLGESLARYGSVLDTVRDHGHGIAVHSEYHRPFSSRELAADQLAKCRARVADYLPAAPWYRPPYGIGNDPMPGYAGPIGWHAHGRDWDVTYQQGHTVAGCVDELVAALTANNGGVALLHDFAPRTEFVANGFTEARLNLRVLEIAELAIDRLRDQGFTLVGLPDPAPASDPD